jgi:hypothetical protein
VSARLTRLALALYPLAYRRRYGEELAALVEDSGASPATAVDLARGAIRAHLRPERSVAAAVDGSDRLRIGASTVLLCWVLSAAAIFGIAKTIEEGTFRGAATAHPLLGGAHLALQALAVIASATFMLGAAPLVVVALSQVRERPAVRRATFVAAGCVVVLLAATAAVVLVAHRSSAVSSGVRTAVLACWIGVGLACALGCALAARRGLFAASVPDPVLRLASTTAAVVAAAMVGIVLATGVYLVAMLVDAPGLAAEGNGPGGLLSVGASIGVFLAVMALAAVAASVSVVRVRRADGR